MGGLSPLNPAELNQRLRLVKHLEVQMSHPCHSRKTCLNRDGKKPEDPSNNHPFLAFLTELVKLARAVIERFC